MMCTINWEYVAAVIGALGSLVAAWIAYLVYQQGKKIKTLTDVVEELKIYNQYVAEGLSIQKVITLKQRNPVISITGISPKGTARMNWRRIYFKNIGVDAKNVTFSINQPNPDYIINDRFLELRNEGTGTLEIKFNSVYDPKNTPVDITMKYESEVGEKYSQRIHNDKGYMFEIDKPSTSL